MNEDLDILMTGFFPYALELKFLAVRMSVKSWADAISNFLESAIASYPQKLQYMVASDDRSCRNKSAAKHFQNFFFFFFNFAIPELFAVLADQCEEFHGSESQPKEIFLISIW